jgi:hypothetical protein
MLIEVNAEEVWVDDELVQPLEFWEEGQARN